MNEQQVSEEFHLESGYSKEEIEAANSALAEMEAKMAEHKRQIEEAASLPGNESRVNESKKNAYKFAIAELLGILERNGSFTAPMDDGIIYPYGPEYDAKGRNLKGRMIGRFLKDISNGDSKFIELAWGEICQEIAGRRLGNFLDAGLFAALNADTD